MVDTKPVNENSGIVHDTLISRSPSALATEFNGEIVIMSIERNEYYSLDDIASDIWRRIEAPCSFAELVEGLATDYDADHEVIAADIRDLLNRMIALGGIRLA